MATKKRVNKGYRTVLTSLTELGILSKPGAEAVINLALGLIGVLDGVKTLQYRLSHYENIVPTLQDQRRNVQRFLGELEEAEKKRKGK